MSRLKRPIIMGVLNVTPDSFSDGGEFLRLDKAVSRALQMIEDGADMIDVGGESSRPGAEPVSEEEELERVLPVIMEIRKKTGIGISIDTTKSKVAAEAVSAGAGFINDISAGTFDAGMLAFAAKKNVPICLMHIRGTPKTMQRGEIRYDDVVGEIISYLKGRIEAAVKEGVKKENIVIDPGIGFGKTVEHNVAILKELGRFKELGFPVMVGTSRKSFIGSITPAKDPHDRLEGSLATVAVAVKNGADILRVHDVKETRRFCQTLAHFWQ